jgi:hypothetical protein
MIKRTSVSLPTIVLIGKHVQGFLIEPLRIGIDDIYVPLTAPGIGRGRRVGDDENNIHLPGAHVFGQRYIQPEAAATVTVRCIVCIG